MLGVAAQLALVDGKQVQQYLIRRDRILLCQGR